MNAKLAWGIAATGLLMFSVGCTQGTGLVRGQSPAEYSQGSCPGCESGRGCSAHGPASGGRGCGDGGGGHHPTHYHSFSYEQPRNLVYPPGTQPGRGGQPGGQFGGQAAVIQYPYYTVKGPSDFFMK